MRLTIGNLLMSGANGRNGAFGRHPCTNDQENEPAICATPHCSGYLPSPGGQGYRIWILGVFSIAWLRTGLPALASPKESHRDKSGIELGTVVVCPPLASAGSARCIWWSFHMRYPCLFPVEYFPAIRKSRNQYFD